ncbi:MAG: flavodoxin family protein [Methanobacterium sp.]|jgi:multimeric flavodoxin WrbA|uniref:flavodoxin family protein n=1 Tax=Methanobacterium sp. TaxID=2164 RepID=UPI003D8F3671
MVKIIGIIGSPRKGGNTEIYVKKALESAQNAGAETEIINLATAEIEPCTACDICKSTGECAIYDDMVEIGKKLQEAHGVIIASPVYFGSVTAQTKIFIDRSRPLRIDFKLKDKVAGAISVGASRNGGQETTLNTIHNFMFIQDMIIVGDGAPLGHYGGAGVSGAAGDAAQDEVGLETSANLGKRVAELAIKLNPDSK